MKYSLLRYNANTNENHNSNSLECVLSRVQDDYNTWIIIRDCDPSDQADIEQL